MSIFINPWLEQTNKEFGLLESKDAKIKKRKVKIMNDYREALLEGTLLEVYLLEEEEKKTIKERIKKALKYTGKIMAGTGIVISTALVTSLVLGKISMDVFKRKVNRQIESLNDPEVQQRAVEKLREFERQFQQWTEGL